MRDSCTTGQYLCFVFDRACLAKIEDYTRAPGMELDDSLSKCCRRLTKPFLETGEVQSQHFLMTHLLLVETSTSFTTEFQMNEKAMRRQDGHFLYSLFFLLCLEVPSNPGVPWSPEKLIRCL